MPYTEELKRLLKVVLMEFLMDESIISEKGVT
jgi:hypothetical protein